MSLPHAILALLQQEEASGYDLARHFASSVGHVWNATHQQIYLELGKLHQSGQVLYDTVSQEGKPDKKVYRITSQGAEELARWLAAPAAPTRVRESLLIKILGSHLVSAELILDELGRHAEEHEITLAGYRTREAAFKQQQNVSDAEVSEYMALRRGILEHESWLQWAAETEELLRERLAKETPSRLEA